MDTENILFEIVVGTYEKYLVGYFLVLNSDEFYLKPSIITEAHRQPIKCIAASNTFLASGGIDEAIQLINMKTRKEIGSLYHHNGTITSLEFYDTYLISSSEDNNICICSTKNWQCLKTLSGHKKSVNCVSIHPSGKMALSVSKDKTLRTWNLIKGRKAYVTNIKKEADLVKWAPDGIHFLVIHHSVVDVYSVENGSILHTVDFKHKICDLAFISENLYAVCGDFENINVYNTATGSLCHEFKAHKTRIKAIKSIKVNDEVFIVTACSDGYVKVWHTDITDADFKIRKVAKVNTGCRPTCMTLITKQ